MMHRSAPLLRPDHVAWINGGVSAIVASRCSDCKPSIVRALGIAITRDAKLVTLLLRPDQSRQVLADLQAGGSIAVVCSQPSTNRTLQIKASCARLRLASAEERSSQAHHIAAMQREIGSLGYPPAFVAALLHIGPQEALVALDLEPEQAFEQTPGPHAGSPLTTNGKPA